MSLEPAADRPALEPGATIAGRYTVVSLLASGRISTVYRVQDPSGAPFAVKLLDPALFARSGTLERFLDEGRLLATLRHPNLVRVFEPLREPPGLVLELVEGETLAAVLAGRRFSIAEAAALLDPVLEAVAEAHLHGIVHRDLRPDNLLLRHAGGGRFFPEITGFGIAKILAEGDLALTRVAAADPRYVSPEQLRSPRNVDGRADVFALGAILYELVTRTRAFTAVSSLDTQRRVAYGSYRPPEELAPDLPPALGEVIRKALAPEPMARFLTCLEFREALRAAVPVRPRPAAAKAAPATTVAPEAGSEDDSGRSRGALAGFARFLSDLLSVRDSWREGRTALEEEADWRAAREVRGGVIPTNGAPLPPGVGPRPTRHPEADRLTEYAVITERIPACKRCVWFEEGGFIKLDRCSKHGCDVEYFFVCDRFQAG